MIVQCENCHTKYNLDESKIGQEGAWVRCSNCDDVFQVLPPGSQPDPAEDSIALDMGALDSRSAGDDEFDLDMELGGEEKSSGAGKFFKVFFWLVAVLLVLAMLFVGALVAMDRLGMAPGFVGKFSTLPGVSHLLTGAAQTPGQADDQEIKMDLEKVRGYFKINQQAGRVFVIQGMVKNRHASVRSGILVRGRLWDAKQNKPVREAVVYAGPVFSPEELRDLSLRDIQAKLANPKGPDGSLYVVTPGGNIPFMVVFANLPNNVTEFTAEVVGSEAQASPQPKQ